jgi:hypothetical protein
VKKPKRNEFSPMDLTGAQLRAARAFLGWTLADLVKASGVNGTTISAIERKGMEPQISGGLDATLDYRTQGRLESMKKIQATLEKAGIVFVADKKDGQGVYCKDSD